MLHCNIRYLNPLSRFDGFDGYGKTWQWRLKHLWSTLMFTGRWVDWKALRNRGFEGVVFDKDNTLTAPYALAVWPALGPSLQECQAIFEGRVALLSNSAGTSFYSVAQNMGGAVLFCIVLEKNLCILWIFG